MLSGHKFISEANEDDFNKETIQCYIEHYQEILGYMQRMARNSYEGDILMSELLIYLMKASDYEMFYDGKDISMKGYFKKCITYTIKRYRDAQRKEGAYMSDNIITYEDEEVEVMDTVASDILVENQILDEIDLDSIGSYRYKYGTDLFMYMYIKIRCGKDNILAKNVMQVYKIDDIDVYSTEIFSVMKLINMEELLSLIRSKVYDVDRIDKVIDSFK